MLIAIDTATRFASLALYDPMQGRVLGEETWYSTDNHTAELMPRLVRLTDQQRVAPTDLTGLVVSLGPGSFTGLRIGLGVAKGIALAVKIPLVGIPTLDVVVQAHQTSPLPIWAILQAGRGRVCAGYYVRSRERWRRQGDYRLTSLEKLCEENQGLALFCGELLTADVEVIRRQLGKDGVIASPAAALRRAAYLAELGWERLARGDCDDVTTLSPIYLREPHIAF